VTDTSALNTVYEKEELYSMNSSDEEKMAWDEQEKMLKEKIAEHLKNKVKL
jgi:hypothetical protein